MSQSASASMSSTTHNGYTGNTIEDRFLQGLVTPQRTTKEQHQDTCSQQQSTFWHAIAKDTDEKVLPSIVRFQLPSSCAKVSRSATPDELLGAVHSGSATQLRRLIEQKADVNSSSARGANPVSVAVMQGKSADIVKMLLQRRADVNHRESDAAWGLVHIWSCRRMNHGWDEAQKVLSVLVDHHADLNARVEPGGDTPLHFVAEAFQKSKELDKSALMCEEALAAQKEARGARFQFQLLVEARADTTARNATGVVPLDLVSPCFQTELSASTFDINDISQMMSGERSSSRRD